MAGNHAAGSRKNRKYGRNENRSPAMQRYRAEERWTKNKKRRMKRHIKRFPGDKQATKLLEAM